MPKKEFFNLNVDKQKNILDAARKEFTSVVYEDASINKIVKDAGISRGSFYCYFENKKDVYLFILKEEITKLVDAVVSSKDSKDKIDIFDASIKLYDRVIDFYINYDQGLIKNICSNMKMEFEKDTLEIESDRIIEGVKQRVSLENIKYKNDDELLLIVGMIAHCIVEGVFSTIFKGVNHKLSRKILKFHLEVIKKGTKKEEER